MTDFTIHNYDVFKKEALPVKSVFKEDSTEAISDNIINLSH